MGLPKKTHIPCHHVLANQNSLKFKKGAPLKQFFNINLGIGIMKKTTFFVRIFDISPCVFTQISIERDHWMWNQMIHLRGLTWYTFDGPRYPKNKKYLKKWNDDIIIPFFQVFLVFGVVGSIKSMPSGYSLDA